MKKTSAVLAGLLAFGLPWVGCKKSEESKSESPKSAKEPAAAEFESVQEIFYRHSRLTGSLEFGERQAAVFEEQQQHGFVIAKHFSRVMRMSSFGIACLKDLQAQGPA